MAMFVYNPDYSYVRYLCQRILCREHSKGWWASKGLVQLRNEDLSTMIEAGVQTLEDLG